VFVTWRRDLLSRGFQPNLDRQCRGCRGLGGGARGHSGLGSMGRDCRRSSQGGTSVGAVRGELCCSGGMLAFASTPSGGYRFGGEGWRTTHSLWCRRRGHLTIPTPRFEQIHLVIFFFTVVIPGQPGECTIPRHNVFI
jgi:hypothetical protein